MPCLQHPDADLGQIIHALARKVELSSNIDVDVIAREIDGFSDAELQALVYEAPLEVVHHAIFVRS